MKKTLLLTLLLLAFAQFSQAKNLKIGYLNIDYAVSSSHQFINASQRVRAEFQAKEKALIESSNKIKNLVTTFKKQQKNLSEEAIKQRITEISTLEATLKKQAIEVQEQFKEKNRFELEKIQDSINTIIKQVAKEQNFDLILYRQVAYASKDIDITTLISEKLKALPKQ